MVEGDDPKVRHYSECLQELLTFSTDAIVSVTRIDRKSSELNVITLFASLIELATVAHHLIEQRFDAGSYSIFRSFLEAFVELKNVCDDEDYREQLVYEYHKDWLRHLRFAEEDNAFFEDIAAADDLGKRIEEHAHYIERAEADGIKSMTVRAKFEKADLLDEYKAIYGAVSAGTHISLRYLLSRHLTFEGETTSVAINRFRPQRLIPVLDSYCGMLLHASGMFAAKFKLDLATTIDRLSAQLEKVRARE